MTQPTTLQLLIAALILTFTGVVLLRKGLRGRLVAHLEPHCRNCKLNLTDINCDTPIPCPNCGTLLRTNTPAITHGKQIPRKIVIASGILLLLLAIPCFSWPKIRTIPAVQNFDVFEHISEPMLVNLAIKGNESAFQVLHDRLIPGTLSDEAVFKLYEHAQRELTDERKPWDTRWGDVIYYTLYEQLLNDEESLKLIQESSKQQFIAHEMVGPNSESLAYRLVTRYTRGQPSFSFRHQYHRNSSPAWKLRKEAYRVLTDDSEIDWSKSRGWSSGGQWSPFVSFRSQGTSIPFPLDSDSLTIRLPVRYKLLENDQVIYTWDTVFTHTVTRLDHEPVYIETETNPDQVRELIQSMQITKLWVPEDPSMMARHESVRNRWHGFATINHEPYPDLSLLGNFEYRLGDTQIQGQQTVTHLHNGTIEIWPQSSNGKHGWLTPYVKNEDFWKRVLEHGSVDIIYTPDESLAEMNPGYSRLLAVPIVFRDVPVKAMVPMQETLTRNGRATEEWVYDMPHEFPQPDPTQAEVFEE